MKSGELLHLAKVQVEIYHRVGDETWETPGL